MIGGLGCVSCTGYMYANITKKYLNTIWIKRKLNNNGKKHKAEKQNTENFEAEKYGDHNYKKTLAVICYF